MLKSLYFPAVWMFPSVNEKFVYMFILFPLIIISLVTLFLRNLLEFQQPTYQP